MYLWEGFVFVEEAYNGGNHFIGMNPGAGAAVPNIAMRGLEPCAFCFITTGVEGTIAEETILFCHVVAWEVGTISVALVV